MNVSKLHGVVRKTIVGLDDSPDVASLSRAERASVRSWQKRLGKAEGRCLLSIANLPQADWMAPPQLALAE
ncbi:MAG: hypothetical protein M1401_20670 [Chloroflexi bacterium]|nr:hypothetical protein [Chloroflexota bacterium]MCL5111240.1 hypothetical protein [Chloroflexota bacterium]